MESSDGETTRVITGYEVFRFGVPMMGKYVNTGRGRRVTISPTVPGAQYRIIAWALDDGTRRSATPAVKSVVTGGRSECKTLTPRKTLAPSLFYSCFCHCLSYSTITIQAPICYQSIWGWNRTELATSY